MKQTLHAVKAFEVARDSNDNLEMIIAGDKSGAYAKKVQKYIYNSRHRSAIQVLGRVSHLDRLKLMQDSSVIVVTSIKEGWGLIVTEANSQGTPAITYDSDGLRDSVINKKTGLLNTRNDPKALGNLITPLLQNAKLYESLRINGWEFSKQFTFDNSYKDFLSSIEKHL